MRRYLLIITCIAIICVKYTTNAYPRNIFIENTVVKQLDAQHYKTSSYNRIGNYEVYFDDPVINPMMTNFLKNIGIVTFRLHSPVYQHINAKFGLWRNLAFYGAAPLPNIIDDFEFLRWAARNGFKVILQINTSNYYNPVKDRIVLVNNDPTVIAKMADSQVEFFAKLKSNNLLSTILYVEFGNEDYIGMTTYPGTDPVLYAKIVKVTIDKLKQVSPLLKYCVVGQSVDFNIHVPKDKGNWSVADWTKSCLLEIKRLGAVNDIDYVAHHAYADDQSTGTRLAKGSRLSATDVPNFENDWNIYRAYKVSETGSLQALKTFLADNGFDKTMIEVNEFRRGGYNTYYNRSYMNLLANLDPWVAFVNDEKVSGSLMWDAFNGSDLFLKSAPWKGPMGYGVFLRQNDGFVVSMPGYLYSIMNKMFGDKAYVLKSSDPSTCAVIDGNKLNILIYSKKSSMEEISLDLKGFNGVAKNIKCDVLYVDSISDFNINPSTLQTKHINHNIISFSKLPTVLMIKPYSINILSISF